MKKIGIISIIIVILGVALVNCGGYKTPVPGAPTALIDGFKKFIQVEDTVFVIAKEKIEQYLMASNGRVELISSFPTKYYVENILDHKEFLFLQAIDGLHVIKKSTRSELKIIEGIRPCNKIYVKDTLLYVLKGIENCIDTATVGLKIYNFKNIEKIKFAKFINLQQPIDFAFFNERIYVATKTGGIISFDASKPANPIIFGSSINKKADYLKISEGSLIVKDSISINNYEISRNGDLNFKYFIDLKK